LPKGYFLPYQQAWITDESNAIISEKSRRIGMTYADSYKTCRDRNLTNIRRDLWFSSADESAALEYALYCKQWCELMEVLVKQITEQLEDENGYKYNNYVIVFPNESRINCMTSNPRRFRSKGGDIVLDEFAWHDEPGLMLDAALPTTTWDYNIRILSTHNGEESEFNRIISLVNKIHNGELSFDEAHSLHWTLHRTTIIDAVAQGLAEKVYKLKQVDPAAREKFLKECRARCRNEDAWNQEYMCKPSTALLALIPYELYQSCEDSNCLQELVPHTKERREYYLGGDIGRVHDRTVFWIDEKVADLMIARKVIKLHKTPYHAQLQMLCDLLTNQNIRRACIDATGIGDMLVEEAQRIHGSYRVEKVKFTNEIKDHLASLGRGMFEDRRCRVPDDREIRESFHTVRKIMTLSGNIRYDAASTEAGHADDLWAFLLTKEAARTSEVPQCIVL
jgi:phage FluMu gp28-like protein